MMELHAATDFGDEFVGGERFYDRANIDALMAYLASMGVKRLEWIYHCWLAFDDSYPLGFDIEAEAVRAAHRHGIDFVAVIKPFECLGLYLLPHAFPIARTECWNSVRGLFHQVSDLAIARPDLCLKRKPGVRDPGGPVTAVRLVKADDRPSGLEADDLSIWTSHENGSWTRYEGPFRLEQSVEWRPLFPKPGNCRVLTLSGLEIPESQRYIEVRTRRPDPNGDFVCDLESVVELVGADGADLPRTPPGLIFERDRFGPLKSTAFRKVTRHWNTPEVEALLTGAQERLAQWNADTRDYAHKGQPYVAYDFNRRGRVAVARGVDEALPIPHPIYPEVRAYWLGKARRFLDLGADGIDFRHCTHFNQYDHREYGFNEPVLERTGGSLNMGEVARVNGEAYTQLLREAAALTHSRGKRFGVHVLTHYLRASEENRGDAIIGNFDLPWERWVREFADYVVFRGAMGYRTATVQEVVDRIGLVCREAGKTLVYQSNRRQYSVDGPLPVQDHELAWVTRHPDVSAYHLYETASFTRLDAQGALEGSEAVRALVGKHGFASRLSRLPKHNP